MAERWLRLFLYLCMILSVLQVASAQPEILSVSGPITHGTDVIISGSGFGMKNPVAPIKWETFEDGTWDSDWFFEYACSVLHMSVISSGNHGVSSKNVLMNCADWNCNPVFSWITGLAPQRTIYINYWIKKHFAFPSSGGDAWANVKVNRFGTDSPPINIGSVFLSSGPDFYSGTEFAPGPDGMWHEDDNWDYISEFSNDTWHSFETMYDLGANPRMSFAFDGRKIIDAQHDYGDATTVWGLLIGMQNVRNDSWQFDAKYWMDDIYIDNTTARVMIGNNQDFDQCTHVEMQVPHTTWNDATIKFTANKGGFNDGELLFLFVVDGDGVVSDGYPVTFGPPSQGDTTPPAEVTTLAVTTTTQTSATLTWTAVGDDGNSGTATTYDLRFSTSVITAYNFNSATQVSGEPVPQVAGSPEIYTVTGLSVGTTYYFALKVADDVPNWDGLSNIPSGTTQPPSGSVDECESLQPSWVFCSGFEEGNLDLWDDWDGNPPETNTLLDDPGPAGLAGNHVVRLRVPPGEGTADLVKVLPTEYDRLYARWYVKWEPGYDFGAANHGSGLHAGSRNNLGRSGYRPDGTDRFTSIIEPQTSDRRLYAYTYYRGMYQDCADPNGSCWGDHFPCMMDNGQVYCTKPEDRETVLPPQLETGRWYLIEMMMDGGTPSADGIGANGILDWWIDGVEMGPWDDLWLRTTPNLRLDVLWLSLYHHGQHSVEGIMFDNVVVSTERIGPLGSPPSESPCGEADTDRNGGIDLGELNLYISIWLSGGHTMHDLISAFGEWKNGC